MERTGSLGVWNGLRALMCGVDWQSRCVGWTGSVGV